MVCPASDGHGGISGSSSSCEGQDIDDENAAAKFACVKVMGTIDANVNDVYELFRDNERVHVSVRIAIAPLFLLIFPANTVVVTGPLGVLGCAPHSCGLKEGFPVPTLTLHGSLAYR